MTTQTENSQQLAEKYNNRVYEQLLEDIEAEEYNDYDWLEDFLEVDITKKNDVVEKVEFIITTGGPNTVLTVYSNGAADLTTYWGSGESTIFVNDWEEFIEWVLDWFIDL